MPRSDPAVDWLLDSNDPSVRYLTLTEVLGESPKSRAAQTAREAIPSGPRVRQLLEGQRHDCGFGVHPYAKWGGAFWRLVSLVDLAIPAAHPGAVRAAEHVLAWVHSSQHLRTIHTVEGRVRQHACQEGIPLGACCRLGMARDKRVRALVESLLRSQWPDGGWNCDPRPDTTHSSFHETVTPLWGLNEYARATGDEAAAEAAWRAAEFLLAHRLFRSHRTGRVIHDEWLKLHYPPYWHYDVLQGLRVLSGCGMAADLRAAEAVDLVEGKRGRDGRWRAGSRFWRPPGQKGSNVEVVDWGRRGPNELITVRALGVLRAAGRLEV